MISQGDPLASLPRVVVRAELPELLAGVLPA
jgi:hypothetical protein